MFGITYVVMICSQASGGRLLDEWLRFCSMIPAGLNVANGNTDFVTLSDCVVMDTVVVGKTCWNKIHVSNACTKLRKI